MSPIAENQIPQVIKKVQERLGKELNAELRVEERNYQIEDDWLYVVVMPVKPGVRASDYADLMAKVEKELRDEDHIENVLLVPTIPD